MTLGCLRPLPTGALEFEWTGETHFHIEDLSVLPNTGTTAYSQPDTIWQT